MSSEIEIFVHLQTLTIVTIVSLINNLWTWCSPTSEKIPSENDKGDKNSNVKTDSDKLDESNSDILSAENSSLRPVLESHPYIISWWVLPLVITSNSDFYGIIFWIALFYVL